MTDYLNDRSWVKAKDGNPRMDIIVAAHLGWTDFIGVDDPCPSGRPPKEYLPSEGNLSIERPYRLVHEYTTQFDEALELIGSLRVSLNNESYPLWAATLWEDKDGHNFNHFVGYAWTPAMAICKAWLYWQENKSHVQPKENLK